MNGQLKNLMGSWSAEMSTPNQSVFPALLTFSADGSLMASQSPFSFLSAGHGNWAGHDQGKVRFSFMALVGNEEGKNKGKLKVVGELQPNTAAGWRGSFKIDIFDTSGQVNFADQGTFNLTRIAVEPMDLSKHS